MTLDEFITAVKERPKGYLMRLADVSGHSQQVIAYIVSGKRVPTARVLSNLTQSIAQADKQQAIRESKTFSYGLPCGYCGNTRRYVANRHCVACAHRQNREKRSKQVAA